MEQVNKNNMCVLVQSWNLNLQIVIVLQRKLGKQV